MKRKDMEDLIENAKGYNPSDEDISMIEDLADEYGNKSEDEMFIEIIRMNDEMEEEMSEEQYQAIFDQLEAMRPIFSEEQNEKLDRVLKILNKDR